MTTTQIFAELLIIGIGVAIWLCFLVASIFGYRFDCSLLDMNAIFLTAIAGVAYVLGIIVDRISYGLFHFIDEYNKTKVFGEKPRRPTVSNRERKIQVTSEPLMHIIYYNRSRLRICRAWIINFGLIALFSAIWSVQTKIYAVIILSSVNVFFCLLTALISHKLSRDYYNNINASYEFLSNVNSRSEGGEGNQG